MAESKKISELNSIPSISDDDEFVVIDKSLTTGQDAALSGKTSKIKFSDLKNAVGTQGLPGAKGEEGTKGEPGIKGPQGPQGDQGISIQGDPGPAGPGGEKGPKGPQGPQGQTGTNGAVGDQGIQGIQGIKGEKGSQGPQGPSGASITGDKGPKGDMGPTGPTGPAGATGAKGPMNDDLLPLLDDGTISTADGTIQYNYIRLSRLVHFQGEYEPPTSSVSWINRHSFIRFTLPSELGYVAHGADYNNTMILYASNGKKYPLLVTARNDEIYIENAFFDLFEETISTGSYTCFFNLTFLVG